MQCRSRVFTVPPLPSLIVAVPVDNWYLWKYSAEKVELIEFDFRPAAGEPFVFYATQNGEAIAMSCWAEMFFRGGNSSKPQNTRVWLRQAWSLTSLPARFRRSLLPPPIFLAPRSQGVLPGFRLPGLLHNHYAQLQS